MADVSDIFYFSARGGGGGSPRLSGGGGVRFFIENPRNGVSGPGGGGAEGPGGLFAANWGFGAGGG